MLKDATYTFPIINGISLASKIQYRFISIGIFFAILGILFMELSGKYFQILASVFMLVFLICCILPIIGNIFFDKYKITGKVIMGSQSISITDSKEAVIVKYLVKDISNLKVTYFESQRQIRPGFYGAYGGLGDGNFLEFDDTNKKKNRYELLIDDDRKLKQILTSWENKGIKFEINYIKGGKKSFREVLKSTFSKK